MEIIELKNAVTIIKKKKTSQDGLNKRVEMTEDRIN